MIQISKSLISSQNLFQTWTLQSGAMWGIQPYHVVNLNTRTWHHLAWAKFEKKVPKEWKYFRYKLTFQISKLDLRFQINSFEVLGLHGIYLYLIFEMSIWEFITNSKKKSISNQTWFFSSSNLIFTACVACSNQFRNHIDFLIF